ncbi:DUF732 domain-containing protein [Mycobacterium xenopi]|uniref:DUF732 domain-containing protein n=1 Tax=Mycobacterium xenopi TaxID=1789 RepID=A0AAD1H5E2_MYCXE|nr:DUF732 domain-containing protein [Mycobacterium xenopi]EID10555.1 hypothetical protein MXEN_17612 [Mycobacterium xenopi RIVM700367]MDA3638942.1 DUF732 domain-containing protein [Mycobacterium xenopi]MDA3657232.1 DUF732 domain-containing protein [Mycobacterium xenopi]MDA3660974.1 DUF732 domain-containing protein [Mycobacterium xenopi]ORX21950.1 hypothetical protein AWC32_21025 [Mycobacterium xenopi]
MVVGVLVAVIAVAGVLVFSWKHQRFVPQDGAPDPQTRSAPSAGPSTGTLDRDGRFLFLLTAQGLQLSAARDVAINDAHRVCSRLERGETEQQIVQDIVDGSPGMSMDTAAAFADTAISVYCPG